MFQSGSHFSGTIILQYTELVVSSLASFIYVKNIKYLEIWDLYKQKIHLTKSIQKCLTPVV